MRATSLRSFALAGALLSAGTAASAPEHGTGYVGLLRARDLTPFGFLRLDMRPAHAVSAPPGGWAIEAELAYQNTWALSPAVEDYLQSLPGRRKLGPAELDAIRALPGENYLIDLELAELDFTFHYKLSPRWGAYAVVSAFRYDGGFLDGAIENFHDQFGFDDYGRPSAARHDINVILELKSEQFALLDARSRGGLLDPTFGLRFSGIDAPRNWNLVLEAAVKLPLEGRRELMSTGRTDVGVQATLQRFGARHAWYASLAGVYYAGSPDTPRSGARLLPTVILGYERRLGARTHLILQGYASRSVYSRRETGLEELRENKYQASLGVYRRTARGVLSFALTENLQNFNNTPDIGFQFGWAWGPALGRR